MSGYTIGNRVTRITLILIYMTLLKFLSQGTNLTIIKFTSYSVHRSSIICRKGGDVL